MMGDVSVRAIRGAITAERDTADAILEATSELLTAMLERNAIDHDALISMLFTTTPDLRAEFPAVAARSLGLSQVPLLCASEIDVPGALGLCIRVMVHANMPSDTAVRHVYLRDAQQLRTDLRES
jgi:chorismate mutase